MWSSAFELDLTGCLHGGGPRGLFLLHINTPYGWFSLTWAAAILECGNNRKCLKWSRAAERPPPPLSDVGAKILLGVSKYIPYRSIWRIIPSNIKHLRPSLPRIHLGHKYGRYFIVLGNKYGRRDVRWKPSIASAQVHVSVKFPDHTSLLSARFPAQPRTQPARGHPPGSLQHETSAGSFTIGSISFISSSDSIWKLRNRLS